MNHRVLLALLCLLSIMPGAYAATPLEAAIVTIKSTPTTASTSEKLRAVTAAYQAVRTATTHLSQLIAVSNKLLFDEKPAATLSLQDQDLLKAPEYAAYKEAATKINGLITAGDAPAIIWR